MARDPRPLRYLLDEDVHPEVAVIASGLGLDIVSVYAIGRRGLSDFDQLRFAAEDTRILVTQNRDDYITLTVEAFRAGDPHHGLLILPHTLPDNRPSEIMRAIDSWDRRWRDTDHPGAYFIDFAG